MGEPQNAPAPPVATSPSDPAPVDTKERLLDASEVLFADRGFEGTSMRAVTQAAGASLSAANYHFGSKEELLRAVLRRRIEPLNRGRLELLRRVEAEGVPLSIEQILNAFMRPALELRNRTPRAPLVRHVAARLFADPPEVVSELKAELMGDVHARFESAIEQALPDISHATSVVDLAVCGGACRPCAERSGRGLARDGPQLDRCGCGYRSFDSNPGPLCRGRRGSDRGGGIMKLPGAKSASARRDPLHGRRGCARPAGDPQRSGQ